MVSSAFCSHFWGHLWINIWDHIWNQRGSCPFSAKEEAQMGSFQSLISSKRTQPFILFGLACQGRAALQQNGETDFSLK